MNTATPAVGNRRLLKLAAFLRTVPRERFNYSTWTGEDWKGKQDLSCGTTACALGWAATMPCFRRLGMQLEPINFPWPSQDSFMDKENGTEGMVTLKGQDTNNPFEVAQIIFGLSDDDAEFLFSPQGYGEDRATPKQVAKKIENYVAKRERMGNPVELPSVAFAD